MKHIELLETIGACNEAIEWAKDYESLEHAWSECKRSDWMLWLDRKMDLLSDKQRRLMACRFVRETPTGDGRTVWDLQEDERSRNAVIVAERYANGESTKKELDAAWHISIDASFRFRACKSSIATAFACTADKEPIWAAYWSAYSAAAISFDWFYARATQSDIIRSYGNPFNINEVTR